MPMPVIGRAGREEFGQRWLAETGDDGRFAVPGSVCFRQDEMSARDR